MGLISGLLTLPLAPVRGVQGIARAIAEEGERQRNDPAAVRSELERIEQAWQDGTITAKERTAAEEALVSAMVTRRKLDGGDG